MIVRRLPLDIYNRCTTFVYGTPADFHRFMSRRYDGELPLDSSCHGHWCVRVSKRGYASDFIFIRKGGSRDDQLMYLAHETLHLVQNTLAQAGMPLNADTAEAYTYYQGWLMRECAKGMR